MYHLLINRDSTVGNGSALLVGIIITICFTFLFMFVTLILPSRCIVAETILIYQDVKAKERDKGLLCCTVKHQVNEGEVAAFPEKQS